MDYASYLLDKVIVLVPFIYIIGMILKGTEKIQDKYIPLILLPIGIVMSLGIVGLNVDAVIQGVLAVGTAVYANQLVKQLIEK